MEHRTLIQTDLFGAPPAKAFYNTNKIAGEELFEANEEAKAQNENVLKLFQEHRVLSPCECWKLYKAKYSKHVLLTSIRRAITTLTVHKTMGGKLIKTSIKVTSPYGAKEYVWKINESV